MKRVWLVLFWFGCCWFAWPVLAVCLFLICCLVSVLLVCSVFAGLFCFRWSVAGLLCFAGLFCLLCFAGRFCLLACLCDLRLFWFNCFWFAWLVPYQYLVWYLPWYLPCLVLLVCLWPWLFCFANMLGYFDRNQNYRLIKLSNCNSTKFIYIAN